MDGAAGMRQLHASAEDRDKVHRDLSLRPRNLKEGADDERMERRGKKSAPKAPKTLKIVFDTLIDQRVLIELRNDTTISGILDFVDPELKCAMLRTCAQPCRAPVPARRVPAPLLSPETLVSLNRAASS
jgi:hypothetical protein